MFQTLSIVLPAVRLIAMKVQEVAPEVDRDAVLADAQFIDAYRVAIAGTDLDARTAAERMFARSPRWIDALLRLRNIAVAPFGLKTSGTGEPNFGGMVGVFPVLSEAPEHMVLGFDDYHLDFRIVVNISTSGRGQEVTATTLVLTHNLLGCLYLATILPFHRLIARTMLRRVAIS